jgi:hypothetical protein
MGKKLRSYRASTLVLVLAGSLFAGLPATTSAWDRPDLAELYVYGSDGTYVSSDRYDQTIVGFTLAGGSLYTSGVNQLNAMAVYANAHRRVRTPSGNGEIDFNLYEPDKVIRKAKLQLISQARYLVVYFNVSTPLTQFSMAIAPTTAVTGAGCKALFKGKDTDGDGYHETTIWRALCTKETLDALGLTEGQREALRKIFGSTTVLRAAGKSVVPP